MYARNLILTPCNYVVHFERGKQGSGSEQSLLPNVKKDALRTQALQLLDIFLVNFKFYVKKRYCFSDLFVSSR